MARRHFLPRCRFTENSRRNSKSVASPTWHTPLCLFVNDGFPEGESFQDQVYRTPKERQQFLAELVQGPKTAFDAFSPMFRR